MLYTQVVKKVSVELISLYTNCHKNKSYHRSKTKVAIKTEWKKLSYM